jgi:pimeloyl-ACP methyl ester carboxylesterase
MARERFIEAGGLRIRYLEEGTGPAVVLLHGASLGSSADVWSGNLADLAARGLRVIALDQPGFGMSDNPEDASLGFRTRFIPEFLDKLRLECASLVGHSQSGRIVVKLGMEEPNRFPRIVVLGTGSLLPPLPGAAKGDVGDEVGASEPTIDESRRQLEETVFDGALVTPEAVELRHRMSTGKNFAAAIARRLAKAEEKRDGDRPLWQRLSDVSVPMRLIYGKDDRSAADRVTLAKDLYPNLDVHLIDKCKHLVQWDAPKALAQLVGEIVHTG